MRPRLLTLFILLLSSTQVCAAGRPEILAAQYIEGAGTAGEAAAQLLAAEQAGEVDAATAQATHAAIRQYQALDSYARAKFIADALWTGWSPDRYNEFWLDQAAMMLRRDETGQAERALRHLRKPWNAMVSQRRYSLWGALYLRRQDYANAVVALDKQVAIAGDGLFDHYSLGLALLQTGNEERGLALLDDIGVLPASTPDHLALRDRVNLAMGWHWLANDQGGTAREFFRRVRLEGPSSNMALLGMGWAELTTDGQPQRARFKRRVLCEKAEVPPDALMRLLSDRYAACRPGEKSGVFDITHDFAFDTAAHGSGRYLEALRPWQVLARREAHDPSVQEALLAAGYANQKRNADSEAEQAYRTAIKRYEAESARLSALEVALRSPDADPPAVVEQQARAGEFAGLRGSHRYVQAMAGRDTLRQAEAELEATSRRLEQLAGPAGSDSARWAGLQRRVDQQRDAILTTRQAIGNDLRQWLLDDLVQRRERLKRYHSRAQLALAQIYDQRGGEKKE